MQKPDCSWRCSQQCNSCREWRQDHCFHSSWPICYIWRSWLHHTSAVAWRFGIADLCWTSSGLPPKSLIRSQCIAFILFELYSHKLGFTLEQPLTDAKCMVEMAPPLVGVHFQLAKLWNSRPALVRSTECLATFPWFHHDPNIPVTRKLGWLFGFDNGGN